MTDSRALGALPDPYGRGWRTANRAQIAALLGDRDEAVRLLQEAISQGFNFASGTHGDPYHADLYFAPLRGYEPFEELIRPKG